MLSVIFNGCFFFKNKNKKNPGDFAFLNKLVQFIEKIYIILAFDA